MGRWFKAFGSFWDKSRRKGSGSTEPLSGLESLEDRYLLSKSHLIDFTGTWDLQLKKDSSTSEGTLTLTQSNRKVTGTFEDSQNNTIDVKGFDFYHHHLHLHADKNGGTNSSSEIVFHLHVHHFHKKDPTHFTGVMVIIQNGHRERIHVEGVKQ